MLRETLEEGRILTDQALERLLPPATQYPSSIHQAMRHSVFAGGKRLRPILCMEAARVVAGCVPEGIEELASALEMLHTYSLIHDDLPALDNDDLRRGRPTCHKAFGDAIAILAGDALLTRAFEVLASDAPAGDVDRQIRVIREVAAAAGTVNALIGGQVADIENEGRQVTDSTLEYIHRSKTGAMIRSSVTIGGIIAGGDNNQIETLRQYGEKIGLAFQVADDILDVTSTSEQLGKTPGKDMAARKATYPALHGIAQSEARARQLVDEAIATISALGPAGHKLKEMASFIIARTS